MNIANFATINQTLAHGNTSEKYQFIPTKRVLDVLADHNWHPAKIQEARTRKEENLGFQKHLIRLRQGQNQTITVGDELPEIVLTNSHMGSAAFQLCMGIYRLVCMNGLTVGNDIHSYRVRHSGYTDQAVSDAINAITSTTDDVMKDVETFKRIELTNEEQNIFAQSAIELKFDGEKYSVPEYEVLKPWRYDDRKNDLWTTFNRVQENMIKGGIRARNTLGQRRRTTSVKSVDENIRLNKGLWLLTEKMAELKQ